MDIYTISATELKERVAEVLNRVYFEKREMLVNRHGKPIAKIVPVRDADKKNFTAVVAKYFGIMPNFPDVKTFRHLRKRKIRL